MEDEEKAELTVSSSRFAEKNKLAKKGPDQITLHDPLIETTPIRTPNSEVKKPQNVHQAQDLMDSVVFGDRNDLKTEEKADLMFKSTKENILNRVSDI